MNQLQVIELSKVYPGGVQALAGVSFTLEKGEFLSVIGPSGSGKTTLFRILNGTEQAASGQVLYDKSQHFEQARGRKKRAMQKRIGTVYQDFCLVEQASCLDNVLNAALPDMGRRRNFGQCAESACLCNVQYLEAVASVYAFHHRGNLAGIAS